jgi:MoxR-like ATPase
MPNDNEKIKQLTDEKPIKLEQMQGWPAGHYKLSPAHVGAIQAAYFCQRPLLVRGGPGLGKSQLAQAIASLLGWGLITSVVHYNTKGIASKRALTNLEANCPNNDQLAQ